MLNEITDEVTKPASEYQPLKKDINALNERVTGIENDLNLYKEAQEQNIRTQNLNATEVRSNSVDAETATFGTETVGSLEATNANITNATIGSINGTVGIDKAVIGELELTHPDFERINVGSLHADDIDVSALDIDELKVNKITSDVTMQDISAGTINAEAIVTEDVETSSIESESIHNDGLLSTGNITVTGDVEVGDKVKARDVQADQAEIDTIDVLTIKNSKNTRNEKSFINLSPTLQTIDDYYVVKIPNTKGLIQMEASDGCWNMSVIKNGKNVIVAYSEVALDKIPVIRYTDGGDIYFSVKCDGQINYVFDVNDVSDTPELDITYTYNEWPEEGTDYIPKTLQHTVIMGNNTVDNGLYVMGQLDYAIGPEETEQLINNLNLKGKLKFVNSEGITEFGDKGYYIASDENSEPHWVAPADNTSGTLSTFNDRLITERSIANWDGSSEVPETIEVTVDNYETWLALDGLINDPLFAADNDEVIIGAYRYDDNLKLGLYSGDGIWLPADVKQGRWDIAVLDINDINPDIFEKLSDDTYEAKVPVFYYNDNENKYSILRQFDIDEGEAWSPTGIIYNYFLPILSESAATVRNNITKLGTVTEGEWKAGDVKTPKLNATEAFVNTLEGNEASITTVKAYDVDVEDGVGHNNTAILFDKGDNADTMEFIAVNNKFNNIEVSGTLDATADKAIKDQNGEVIDETYVRLDTVGEANGIASLDSNGKLPLDQLPTEAIVFKGMWDASTNTPTLADGTGTSGDYYIVSVGGTRNLGSGNITFVAGDGVIYDGSKWNRKADTNLVQSVNGDTGNVTVKYLGEYLTTIMTEGSIIPAAFWDLFPVGMCEVGVTIGSHGANAIVMKKNNYSGSLMVLDNTDNSVYLAQMGKALTKILPVEVPDLPFEELTYPEFTARKAAGTLDPSTVYYVGV